MTGPVTQPRIRPWSTQLIVPTDQGRVWFKACCPSMSFEPVLRQKLAELAPQAVAAPLGADGARGWMLTVDHGPNLGEAPTDVAWSAVIRRAAELQRRLAAHGPDLIAAGLPDCSPLTVPERFDGLIDALERLPAHAPHRLDAAEAGSLRSRRRQLAEACSALAESPFGVTFQHGDLHLKNACGSVDDVRLFDFGDAQWASAVEVMGVPYAVCRLTDGLRWSDLVADYLEVWNLDHTAWGIAWNAGAFTHPVNRALTWWECLRDAGAEEWAAWGDAPAAHLREIMSA